MVDWSWKTCEENMILTIRRKAILKVRRQINTMRPIKRKAILMTNGILRKASRYIAESASTATNNSGRRSSMKNISSRMKRDAIHVRVTRSLARCVRTDSNTLTSARVGR
ncbi:hypothetical protein ACHAXM_000871, partial [Skeletonema potamos]